jgi:hypothetical protein
VNLRQLHPVAESQTVLRADDDVFARLEVLRQDVEDPRRHVGFDLQQRERASTQLAQAAVHRFEQIVGLVLFDLEVRVADDAEQMRAFDVGAGKQLVDVGANDVLEEDEGEPLVSGQRIGDDDESRQHVGDLDARELGPIAVPHDTAKFLLKFEMNGNGCPGSNARA